MIVLAGCLLLAVMIVAYSVVRVAEKSIAAGTARAVALREAEASKAAAQRIDDLVAEVQKLKDRMARQETKR